MNPHDGRREFLKAMGRSLVVGGAAAGGVLAGREVLLRRQEALRRESGSGWLIRSPEALEASARDFGGVCYQKPAAVFYPQTPADIQQAIRHCRREGLRVNSRGSAHSCNGQSLIADGVSIDLKPFMNQVELEGELAVIGGGVLWQDVYRFLEGRGRAAPVCPDYLGMTVTGNAAVGGGGHRTVAHGFVADQVERLEVVTGAGDLVRCSRQENPGLFRHALFGLGQLAVITRMWMRTVPARKRVMVAGLPFTSLPEFLRAAGRLAAKTPGLDFDLAYALWSAQFLCGELRLGRDLTGQAGEEKRFEALARSIGPRVNLSVIEDYDQNVSDGIYSSYRLTWDFRHLWLDFFPPLAGFEPLFRQSQELMLQKYPELRPNAQAYFVFIDYERAGAGFPFATFPRGTGRGASSAWYIDVPRTDLNRLERAKEFLAECTQMYLSAGAGIYLYGWYRLTAEQRRQLWQPALPDFFSLKNQTDPDNIIAPDGIINSLQPRA